MLKPVIIGAFGPPSLACIRSWGRQGWEAGLISVQNPEDGVPFSKYLSAFSLLPRKSLFTDTGIESIAAFLDSFSASGVMCIDEKIAVWLNENRERFSPLLQWWVPPTQTVNRVLCKIEQIEAARKVGLEVLPTYLFSPKNPLPEIPTEHFPLCLRPSRPNSTLPAFKVTNAFQIKDIEDFLWRFESVESPLIGQPFVNMPNLVVHGARSEPGETFGLRGFLVGRKFQGVTLTICPFELDNELGEKCKAFTDELGLIGNYHFEFLLDPLEAKAYFLELNYRFGGTTAKVMACGYDEPAWAMRSWGVESKIQDRINSITVSSKQALAKSLICALKNELTALDYPEEKVLKRVLYSLYGMAFFRDDIFCADDFKGATRFYTESIKAKLKIRSTKSRRLRGRESP